MNLDALQASANECERRGDFRNAAAAYARMVELAPGDLRIRLRAGNLLNLIGKRDAALDHLSIGAGLLKAKIESLSALGDGGTGPETVRLGALRADLEALLRRTVEACDQIKTRMLIADERRRIRPADLQTSICDKASPMRIGVLITLWKRHALADLVLARCRNIKERVHPEVELELLAVGSEGAASQDLAERNGFDYLEQPNEPLGAKRNAGLRLMREKNVDAVLCVDSDDFIDEKLVTTYAAALNQEYDLLGILDLYYFDLNSLQACYWPGYADHGGRRGETLGLGRCIRRRFLDDLDWKLWADDLNRGLDGSMIERIASSLTGSPEKYKLGSISIKEHGITAIDVKSSVNLWSFDQMMSVTSGMKYQPPVHFLEEHFTSSECRQLLGMSEAATRLRALV